MDQAASDARGTEKDFSPQPIPYAYGQVCQGVSGSLHRSLSGAAKTVSNANAASPRFLSAVCFRHGCFGYPYMNRKAAMNVLSRRSWPDLRPILRARRLSARMTPAIIQVASQEGSRGSFPRRRPPTGWLAARWFRSGGESRDEEAVRRRFQFLGTEP